MPYVELMRRVKMDEYLTGNAYMEVVRNNKGKIVSLYHVPAHTVRLLADGTGFVQIQTVQVGSTPGIDVLQRATKVRYFKNYGGEYGMDATNGQVRKKIATVKKASELIHFKPTPGTLIIFPGYLEHEYAVDFGIEPFRFIHWNIQAVPKEMAKDV